MEESYPEVDDNEDNEGLRWITESNWLGVLDKFLKSIAMEKRGGYSGGYGEVGWARPKSQSQKCPQGGADRDVVVRWE